MKEGEENRKDRGWPVGLERLGTRDYLGWIAHCDSAGWVVRRVAIDQARS